MQQWNACAALNCCMLNSYNSCIIISDVKRMLVWNCNYSLAAPIQSSFLIAIKAFEFIGYYDNLFLCQDKYLAPNFEIISRFIMECTESGGEWTIVLKLCLQQIIDDMLRCICLGFHSLNFRWKFNHLCLWKFHQNIHVICKRINLDTVYAQNPISSSENPF